MTSWKRRLCSRVLAQSEDNCYCDLKLVHWLSLVKFLPRDAMLARYMPWSSMYVCSSQADIVSKRLNAALAQGLSDKDPTGSSPNWGFKARFVKIGHFRQRTSYNSEMVQDRCIVSVRAEYVWICMHSINWLCCQLLLLTLYTPKSPYFIHLESHLVLL